MTTIDRRDEYRRQIEQYEAEAAEWAAKAARTTDERLRGDYEARAWQARRSAERARRLLAGLEQKLAAS